MLRPILVSTILCSISFSQTIIHELESGDQFADNFGLSVAGPGDLNSDGYDDFIVGDTADDTFANNAGAIHVYSGRDASILWEFFGPAPSSYLGEVAGIGDVTQDGVGDVVVGAMSDDGGGNWRGHAWVLSGDDGSVLFDLTGSADGDAFGHHVEGLGDVDADGVPDFGIAALQYQVGPGYIKVFSGVDAAVLHHFPGTTWDNIHGTRVGRAGDVNGDGHDDVLVGDYQYQPGQGRVQVRSGADGTVLYELFGRTEFGLSMDRVQDLDQDGRPELLIGAPGHGPYGSALLFSGRTGALVFHWDGSDAGNTFMRYGQRVAAVGDTNGDGASEVAIGIIWQDTTNTDAGAVQVRSGLDGSLLFTSFGDTSGGSLGYGLDTGGDVNRDGVPDIVMGQPGASPSRVRVVSGNCTGPTIERFCVLSPNSVGAGTSLGWIGSSSMSAGDLTLTISGGPPTQFGVFFYSFDETNEPFFDGVRCIKGQAYYRLLPPVILSSQGEGSYAWDLGGGDYGVFVGAITKVQFWHRDPGAGGTGVNTSNGLSITVCD